MSNLSLQYINLDAGTQLDDQKFFEISGSVVVPDVTIEDAREFGFTVDKLQEDDYDVPEEEKEANKFVVEVFKESDAYEEWKQSLTPAMMYLYECEPEIEGQKFANLLHEHGLSCVFVEGNGDDQTSGIMLNGGGMDLSDNLAAAYVLAGHVPPYQLLLTAFQAHDHLALKDKLVDAAKQAADYWRNISERFEEIVEKHLDVSGPKI